MNKIPIPPQPKPDPFHPFLVCPKCNQRKLRTLFIPMVKGRNKKGLKCSNSKCDYDPTNYKGSKEEAAKKLKK